MKENVRQEFIKNFSKSLKRKSASFFIGSGLSIKAGYPSWSSLLTDCANEIELDIKKENKNLINLAQYYFNEKQKNRINESIKEKFADKIGDITEEHKVIASLPIEDIWTTNYDTLIERSFDHYGIANTVITNDESYVEIDRDAKVKVFKMHGTVSKSKECVITRDDYERYNTGHDIVLSQLKSELCYKTFLFVGYSFSDMDVQFIFEQIRKSFNESKPQTHYFILKNLNEDDYDGNHDEYLYDLKKRKFYIKDIQRYGITVLEIDDYSEIYDLLVDIRNCVFENNVLITGAYSEENEIKKDISDIAEKVSFSLITSGYTIYSGYGKNLGADVVNGAFDACSRKNLKFEEVAKFTPFPFKKRESDGKKKQYAEIRKKMISKTRIMIVISGEKNGKVSEGVLEEFRIAKDQNNLIIPIKCTGGAAAQVWDDLKEANQTNQYFLMLENEQDSERIAQTVINMIKEWEK